MIHKSNEFNAIMALASEFGLTAVIAGGYPRDLAFNRQPKDLDICVYNTTKKAWDEFVRQMYVYDLVQELYEHISAPSRTEDDRVYEVIQAKGNIDIILWEDRFESMEDVLNNFDFNINQWILSFPCDYDGSPYTQDPMPLYVGTPSDYGELIDIRNDGYSVSNCRRAKMENLAKELNWSIKCPINQIPI